MFLGKHLKHVVLTFSATATVSLLQLVLTLLPSDPSVVP